ncbi:hypothetical protein AGLY_012542 [Aphis glycines]|uniref:G-protein coupled receptors family 1 profile domain-containing protein n=1 Tax=Aphis glycines TaxID=307491 RepID=A0A6G0T8T1_APHGL|nr:hypothetical protein AGLY_012542 [Aphis glycines]
METTNSVNDQCNYTEPVTNNTWEKDTLDNEYSHFLYITFTPVLILLCVFSIVFNVILLLSVLWIRRPLSPTLYISLSLAGTDLYTSFLLGLGHTFNSLLPVGFQVYLMDMCTILGLEALRLGAIVTTAGHLIMLAFNHYIGILRPLHYPATVTHGTVTVVLFFLWTLPPSFLFAYFHMIPCQAFQSPQCKLIDFLKESKFRSTFSAVLFAALTIMGIVYYHIFILVKKHQASRLLYKQSGSVHSNKPNQVRRQAESQQSKNEKALYTTLIIVGSVVVGWMPACLQYYLICTDCIIQPDWGSLTVKFYTYFATNCLVILKSAVNSYIYAARMQEIQVAIRKMYCTLKQKLFGFDDEIDVIGFDQYKYSRSSAKSRRTVICRISVQHNKDENLTGINQDNIINDHELTNFSACPKKNETPNMVTYL